MVLSPSMPLRLTQIACLSRRCQWLKPHGWDHYVCRLVAPMSSRDVQTVRELFWCVTSAKTSLVWLSASSTESTKAKTRRHSQLDAEAEQALHLDSAVYHQRCHYAVDTQPDQVTMQVIFNNIHSYNVSWDWQMLRCPLILHRLPIGKSQHINFMFR